MYAVPKAFTYSVEFEWQDSSG